MFGAVAIGLYVGAEVSIGSIMINFLNQPDVLGISFEDAGGYSPTSTGAGPCADGSSGRCC